MNLRTIKKKQAADSIIGSPLKIDFRADWTHESIPTAWDLKYTCWSLNLTPRLSGWTLESNRL